MWRRSPGGTRGGCSTSAACAARGPTAATITIDHYWADRGLLCFWIFAALALAGAFTAMARRAPWYVWAFPVLSFLSVVFLVVETPRYRTPIDPFLVLLATAAARHRRAVRAPPEAPKAARPCRPALESPRSTHCPRGGPWPRFPTAPLLEPYPLRSGHEGRRHQRHRVPEPGLKLAEHYRFASIGGTSAGAIAAALSAAAEYGRHSTTAAAPRSSRPRSSRSGSPAPSWASSSRRPPRGRCSR